ncbi:MAG: AzlD domain-containing protein [Halobaculum sp.]
MSVWLAVVLAGVGTYALRASFLFLFDRLGTVPSQIETALGMVPAAVLAALVVPAVLAHDGSVSLLGNTRLVAAALAGLVAWYTESVLATILIGLVALVAFGLV